MSGALGTDGRKVSTKAFRLQFSSTRDALRTIHRAIVIRQNVCHSRPSQTADYRCSNVGSSGRSVRRSPILQGSHLRFSSFVLSLPGDSYLSNKMPRAQENPSAIILTLPGESCPAGVLEFREGLREYSVEVLRYYIMAVY